ncbi:hypothetical protein Rhe02_91480 [Rhizocola hellebori]|uniref:DUF3710 domain-containing protein n=1 Tax=Rhizocola hellebori TaxID=1392758 RepID=A0A8J3VMD2_9ACTN|nr:DUF3710 domain-containing protein [Rhizocola hellebori]GIH11081.1 hypothetical protein Rhe02_91480 [Rhizocola hellebori]
MIFSRRSRAGRHARADEPRATATLSPAEKRRQQREAMLAELNLTDEFGDAPSAAPAVSVKAPEPVLDSGPYDFAEAPDGERVDLGSLLIPGIDGIEIRLQAGEDGAIQQIVLAHGSNALQLGAFAAPRSGGLWDEVRAEIRKSLFDDGVGAEETPGRWGMELRARLRTQNGFDDLRFIGIDGPRWMVRAVFQGPAAVDPALGGPLNECLAGLVVRRDDQARPTREALPLNLPAQAEVQGGPQPEEPAFEQVPRRKPSPRPRRD